MKLFNKSDYALALEEVKGVFITTRPGDPERDYKSGSHGVRILVNNLGSYQTFMLTKGSKKWLKDVYNMTDEETNKIYRMLQAKGHQHIKAQEKADRANHKDFIPGTRKAWRANPYRWG